MNTPSIRLPGLSSEEAKRRLLEFGMNDPVPVRRAEVVRELLHQFSNPLVLILLVASGVSAALGEVVNSSIIATIVVVSIAIDFWQSYHSKRAIERLRSGVAPVAEVLRESEWREIPRREVVVGDILRVESGDLVPADARLLEATDLQVQEAALTGESLPTLKSVLADGSPLSVSSAGHILLGTSVMSGSGVAEVVGTGKNTLYGDIVVRLQSREPESEFERGLKHFGFLIMKPVLFLVLFVLCVNLGLHRPGLQSLLFAVSLAVGLTPEFLPMISTITLTRGALRMAKKHVVVKRLPALQNLGSMDTLCCDKTGTLTSGVVSLLEASDASGMPDPKTHLYAYLNSYFGGTGTSPLDKAVLGHSTQPVDDYSKLEIIPFDFDRRRMSVVVGIGDRRILITKGAPERVLEVCDTIESSGSSSLLQDSSRSSFSALCGELGDKGLRVIAVAYRELLAAESACMDSEAHMVMLGIVTFSDPLLPDAAEALGALRRDGVTVKVISGDSEQVTRNICNQVGIDSTQLVLGSDLDAMSDAALGHVVEASSVFARTSPAQKSRIILALQRRSHVVGFLGDGINDAPSLHSADVGISVSSASDVAQDAADIILMKSGLAVLHEGVLEGRRAFGNVMKYLLMGTSSNFGNMFSMAGASLILPYLPMLPTQILLNSFLYDLAQITIPSDNVDRSYLRSPHRWNIAVIRDFMLWIGPISSLFDFLTFFVLIKVFHANDTLFHTGWFVESLATQTLVLFVIRTRGRALASAPSRPLVVSVLAAVGVAVVLPYTPLSRQLGLVPLPFAYLAFVMVATAGYLVLVEYAKRRLFEKHRGS